MEALVLKEYNRLEFEEVPEPIVGAEDVLIQVKACGICGSDVHGMDGSSGRRIPPIIMGHEAAGIVAAVATQSGEWQPGDRVTFDSTVYCGMCYFCRRGLFNLCDNRRVLGVSCADYRRHGALAEYIAVPHHILYRLPDELSFEHAAMVEPVSIAVHAVNIAPIRLDDTVLVVGAGTIGLLVIQALRLTGCKRIIVVDLDQSRLNAARDLGADVILQPEQRDVGAEIATLTENRGVDIAFEAVGVRSAVATALSHVRKGGSVVLIGNIAASVDLPLQAVVTREVTLYGSCGSLGEYPACLSLIARGAVDVGPMISATAPLEEGASWFQRLYQREPGLIKVILAP